MIEELASPPAIIAYPIIAILALAIVDLAIVILFFFKLRRLDAPSTLIYCKFKLRQIKYLAILSLTAGIFGSVLQARRVFLFLGIAGSGRDRAIGYLGDALDPLLVGIIGFMLGVLCMIVVHMRGSLVMPGKRACSDDSANRSS
jgi:hypothetical protein